MGREIVRTILKVIGLNFVYVIIVFLLCFVFLKKIEKSENPNMIVNVIAFAVYVVWLILIFNLI